MKLKLVALSLLLFASTASADAVKDKLDQLEAQVRSFQADSVARNEKVASALATIDQLRIDYQSVQGTLDANSHIIKQLENEVSRLKRDITDRFAAIEDRMEIYDQQVTKAVAKVLPGAATEAESYQKALDLVQQSDFLSAVAAFRTFLKNYPKNEMADNARYWIGECYFALKDYPKAIKEFQAMLDAFPKSAKAPAAILKQGYAFAELGMIEEAKTFLNKVISTYPSTNEAIRAKEKLDRMSQKSAMPVVTPAAGAVQPAQEVKPPDAHDGIPLAPGVKNQSTQTPAAAEKTDLPRPVGKDR